jgi:hypothetical protein
LNLTVDLLARIEKFFSATRRLANEDTPSVVHLVHIRPNRDDPLKDVGREGPRVDSGVA